MSETPTRTSASVTRESRRRFFQLLAGSPLLALAYPALAALLGHSYPHSPTFGVPTPVTIFTLGMLLLTRAPYARLLFAVPMFWVVLGSWIAFELRIREDIGLIVAAALVVTMTPTRDDPEEPQPAT